MGSSPPPATRPPARPRGCGLPRLPAPRRASFVARLVQDVYVPAVLRAFPAGWDAGIGPAIPSRDLGGGRGAVHLPSRQPGSSMP